jgi:putative flippase GtrA
LAAAADDRPPRRVGWEAVRHATTSLLATAVDYLTMVVLVSLVGVRPVPATAIAATAGAITSFAFNRSFTYRATDVAVRRQLWRFVLVSGSSLVLNTFGEYVMHNVLGLQYMLARVITSIVVSGGWNYPMLRFFVFSGRPPAAA